MANVSQHLQVLRAAKLVEAGREGTRTRYRLADEKVLKLWLDLRTVAEEHFPEVRQLRAQYSTESPEDELDRDELQE